MDDAPGMGGLERIRDVDAERQKGRGLQWPSRNAVVQAHSVEKLHHDEGTAFVLAEVVDGANARMVEGRGGSGFPAEAFQGLRVRCHCFRKELECDGAA